MEREIDLFTEQSNTPSSLKKEPLTVAPTQESFTNIKSLLKTESKEVPIYIIEKGAIIYPLSSRRGVLQNKDGLRCIKVLNDEGKTKKNTATGLSQYQALEHYHLYLNDEYRSHAKNSIFSTYSRLAKKTRSPSKK